MPKETARQHNFTSKFACYSLDKYTNSPVKRNKLWLDFLEFLCFSTKLLRKSATIPPLNVTAVLNFAVFRVSSLLHFVVANFCPHLLGFYPFAKFAHRANLSKIIKARNFVYYLYEPKVHYLVLIING